MTVSTVRNSSTDSTSGSSSDSSSSGSSSSSSGSASSSSDSESSASETPVNNVATTAPKSPTKQNGSEDSNSSKKKDEKTRSVSVTKVSSSSEGEPPKPVASKPVTTRRRSSAKPKESATVPPKQTKPATKSNDKLKTNTKTAAKNDSQNSLKKKSIFSPDNSSESDDDKGKTKTAAKVTPPTTRGKGRPRKSSNKDVDKTPVKKDEPKESKRRSASSSSGPPSKKTSDNKPSTSSCTSSQSSANSDSDSVCEPDTPKKPTDLKTGKTKPPPSNNSKPNKNEISKLSVEASKPITRKLTRSFSARVSRLIKARPATDTDSETDEKSSDKKSRRGQKSPAVPAILPIPEPSEPQERRCPVRGCDSQGHLGGKSERHFTWDACPLYHNVSATWCVAMSEERQGAHAARKKALLSMQQRPRHQPTIDQRAYQLKVKDMRSKWRGSQELKEKLIAAGNPNDEMTEEREPILDGFVPEYDLKLFREAQAQAAIKIEEELEDIPTHKGNRFVVMGKYMMEVWYQSPYPGDAARVPRLFVCEYCLNHHKSEAGAERHKVKCVWRHPPGDEVYRKDNLSVWQVDGRKHKHYCQQLCLLAKFFLDHKTLYYDVEPFLFYVMTVADKEGCHVVGYFSKEKNSFLNYNVSCILTLPPYQRQGYGRLLIDFSYLLTKVEGKVGSPETPLSDLGLISYRSYWKEALLRRLCSAPGPTLSIRDLSRDLAIASCDIVSTLQERGLMKYWKGKHIVLKKQDVLEEVARRAERARCVEAACLRWTPPAPPPR